MIVAIPKEIKDNEARVAITPDGVSKLRQAGVRVLVEKNGGMEIGISDADYIANGAEIAKDKQEIYAKGDIIFKVKEPQKSECLLMREGQVIFSYLHLAAEPKVTKYLLEKKVVAIAFETVDSDKQRLPLLKPMSEVAGKIATQFGAFALQKNNGGPGLLLGGVTNVDPVNVTVIGGGIVGYSAALIADGMGAKVTIIERSKERIAELDKLFAGRVNFDYSENLRNYLPKTELLIGAVLLPGEKAPKLLKQEDFRIMPHGSVFVDVAIDQGGCSETSRPTTHSNPTYIIENVTHYCVTNIPAAASKTATHALESETLPYLLNIVKSGYKDAFAADANFLKGLNLYHGKVTNEAVASALGYDFVNPNIAIG